MKRRLCPLKQGNRGSNLSRSTEMKGEKGGERGWQQRKSDLQGKRDAGFVLGKNRTKKVIGERNRVC